jgi:hypothetical protein
LPAESWERGKFNEPVVTENGGTIDIRVDEAPAGVSFTSALDPALRYVLKVEGKGGPMTMRVRQDEKPYEYLAAPDGSDDRVIFGASRIELLFYNDKPASYSVERLEIEPCATCRTADDLKARILSEAPGVAGATGLDKAIALLKWAANMSDDADDPTLIPPNFEHWPAEKAVYDFFDLDKGGVYCAGHAVFFSRILHLFDIDAFTIGFGVADTFVTHVTVVIPYEDRFYVLDPTFGLTFELGGKPVSVGMAVEALRSGGSNRLVSHEIGLERRDMVEIRPGASRICAKKWISASGESVCRIGASSLWTSFRRRQKSEWEHVGVRLDDAGLFRLMLKGVLNVGPSLDPKSRERFIARLKELEIPFSGS